MTSGLRQGRTFYYARVATTKPHIKRLRVLYSAGMLCPTFLRVRATHTFCSECNRMY